MSKQIVLQDDTYKKLDILRKEIGRNYSYNKVVSRLIGVYLNHAKDESYKETRLRELSNEMIQKAKSEELIKIITPEFQTLIFLILSGKFYAAQVYLKSFFGGIIRSQKQKTPE